LTDGAEIGAEFELGNGEFWFSAQGGVLDMF
jgi:hypothetical protein